MSTPNVVITNPKARLVARTILDTIGAALIVTMAVDAATAAFDLLAITTPVLAGWGAARTVFGLTVDNRNTPTPEHVQRATDLTFARFGELAPDEQNATVQAATSRAILRRDLR